MALPDEHQPEQAPPVSAASLRAAMAHFPTAVTIVTAPAPDGPAGLAANAVTSLSLEPPLMLACLDVTSRTLAAIRGAGRFGINLLAAEHEPIARSFARKVPMPEKWEGVGSHHLGGIPALDGAVVALACELGEVHLAGDHEILIGRVIAIEAAEHGADPLIFHAGGYG